MKKVSLSDVVSSKPSRAAKKAVKHAARESIKEQEKVSKRAKAKIRS